MYIKPVVSIVQISFFFLNYWQKICQQNALSSFNTLVYTSHKEEHSKVLCYNHNKKFKIMHYCYPVLIRLDPHWVFTKCSIISFIAKQSMPDHTLIKLLCFFSCLWSRAVLQSFFDLHYLNTFSPAFRPVIFVNWIFLIFPYDYI